MDRQGRLHGTDQLIGDMHKLEILIPSESPWRAEVDRLQGNSWSMIRRGEVKRKGEEQSGGMAINLKRVLEFSSAVTAISFAVLMSFIFGYRRYSIGDAHSLQLIVSAFVTFSTFLSGFILMFLALNLLTLNRPRTRRKYRAVIVLGYVSSILLILTILSLLVLLPKKYAILSFILLPIVVLLGLLIYYHGLQSDQFDGITSYEGQKAAELKRSSKLSSTVTILSFGGMTGCISGYTKNISDLVRKPHINVGFFLIFTSSLFGLLSMLLALVLPGLNSPITTKRLITFIKFLNYSLLISLAVTAIAFAHVFIEGFVMPAFFPTILGALVWFAMEFGLKNPADDAHCFTSPEVIELKLISRVSTAVTSITFGGITTIFTAYIGSQAHSLQLNICVFFILSAFISGLSVMLLTFRPPNARSFVVVVRVLTCCAIGLLALAALNVILLVV